jgi:hypothetical protein
MKILKSLLICLFLIGTIALVNAQTVNTQVNSTDPEISFDKVVHDYGTIKKGSDGSCNFTFKNKGKEPLILSDVRSSCGCTVPTWPKEPVMPGQSGVIKVVYDTKKVGGISKTITVISNATNSTVVLSIKGSVIE